MAKKIKSSTDDKIEQINTLLSEVIGKDIDLTSLIEETKNTNEEELQLVTEADSFNLLQNTFIAAYRKTFGNVSAACQAVGIYRRRYYEWRKSVEGFADYIDSIEPQEQFLDFAERKLAQKINEGDTRAIMFFLRTKGKARGYLETKDVLDAPDEETVHIYLPDNGRDDHKTEQAKLSS